MNQRQFQLMASGVALSASWTWPSVAFTVEAVSPGVPQPVPFSSLAADGWQATVASPTDLSLTSFTVQREGYNNSGLATTYGETLYLTKRVRQAYPNEGSFTTDQVAISRHVYDGDTLVGATNNSTLVSPKPNGRWMMPRQMMVGDTDRPSVEAFHVDARSGRQVACVKIEYRLASDDSLVHTETISTPIVSTICNDDAFPIHCYETDVDISGFADGLYYRVAKIYPWFGGAASVRSSEDGDARRDFDRVYFTKNTARFNSPPLAYVNTATGNDGTGVWSTTAATAKASPFATERGALDAIDGDATTGSIADGCIVYFEDGTHTLQGAITTSATPQNSASLRYKRSPDSASRAACILQFGTSQFDPNLGINTARNASTLDTGIPWAVLTFEDVTLDRVGASNFGRSATGTASNAMLYQFVDVTLDNNAQTSRWLDSNIVTGGIFGMEFITTAGNNALLGGGSSVEYILQRGITCADLQGSAWDGFSVAGCDIGNAGTATFENNTWGSIVSNSRFHTMSGSWVQENWASGTVVDRIHWLNIEAEYISTSTTNVFSSLAGTSGSTRGMTVHHVTVVGAQNAFRFNVGYDNQNNTASNEQTHELLSLIGVTCNQINIKGDIYRSDANGADGNFASVHGVNWEGLYTMYQANSLSQEHPSYGGLNSDLNEASATLAQDSEASLFVDHQAVTAPAGTLTAGTGGGDYTPAASSPLDGMVTERLVCSIGLGGTARTLPAASGARV